MPRVYNQTLLNDMRSRQSLPKSLVTQAAQEILAIIGEGLERDGVVSISQFGTFRLKPVSARQGINPQTRERITIPAHQRVTFTPSKSLRELIQPMHQPTIPIHASEHRTSTAFSTPPPTSPSPMPINSLRAGTQAMQEGEEQTQDAINDLQSDVYLNGAFDPRRKTITSPVSDPVHNITEPSPGTLEEPVMLPAVKTGIPSAISTDAKIPQDSPAVSSSMDPGVLPQANNHHSQKHRYFSSAALVLVVVAITASLLQIPTPEEKTQKTTIMVGESNTVATVKVFAPVPSVESAKNMNEMGNDTSFSGVAPGDIASNTTISGNIFVTSKSTLPQVNAPEEKPRTQTNPNRENVAFPAAISEESGLFFNEQSHRVIQGESLWRLANKRVATS